MTRQLPLFPGRPPAEALAELHRLQRIRSPQQPGARASRGNGRPLEALIAQARALTEDERRQALERLQMASPRTRAEVRAWLWARLALLEASPKEQHTSPGK